MDFKAFQNPPVEYRSIPFWSLNHRLEAEQIRRQVAELKRGGWGGGFLHAREGLITPYLSGEWMHAIDVAVQESGEQGLRAWLYDEDRWPSGFAGGEVPAKGPEYRQKMLVLSTEPLPENAARPETTTRSENMANVPEVQLLKVYGIRKSPSGEQYFQEIPQENAQKAEERWEKRLFFYRRVASLGHPWFNGYSYVDLLNPRVTKAFIACTHEKYAELFKGEFGRTIPGIFTDEPCVLFQRGVEEPALPWTENFPEYFYRQNGYDILDHLPELFLEIGEWRKTRLDFWRTISGLFVESYTKQLYEWCSKNGLILTGHFMSEDDLVDQIRWSAEVMPHYEFQHYPGIDHLGRHIDHDLTARQVSSVAHQLGKTRVLSELYGTSGQNLSFEDRKWITDWHLIHGINFFTPHLSLYSMAGCRKRDYPPNLFFQQPWWKYNRLFADYVARLCYALTQGQRVVDILVLHPMDSAWMLYNPGGDNRSAEQINSWLGGILRGLLGLHRDFDLGHEGLMEKHGRLSEGTLWVGQASYKVVIVPPCLTLRSSTKKLLEQFLDAGGVVLAVKPFPTLLDGQKADLYSFLQRCHWVENRIEGLKEVLDRVLPPDVSIENEAGEPIPEVWYHHRRLDHRDILFLANTSRGRSFRAWVRMSWQGALEEWDPSTGERRPVKVQSTPDGMRCLLWFPPVGSRLLVTDRRRAMEIGSPEPEPATHRIIPLEGEWSIRRDQPNALTLDYCRYRMGSRSWSARVPTWRAREQIEGAARDEIFELEFEFDVRMGKIPQEIFLVMETPTAYRIALNGQTISSPPVGYWWDKAFEKIPIAPFVRPGKNILHLTSLPRKYREVEDVYIIGDFGVFTDDRKSFYLAEEKSEVFPENLTDEGYAFYVGDLILQKKVFLKKWPPSARVLLRFPRLKAIALEIRINAQMAGRILWPPYQVEVTPYLHPGENELEVRLTSSLRNLLGPNHHAHGELYEVGPESFCDLAHWVNCYNLLPLGFAPPQLIVLEQLSYKVKQIMEK